MALFSACIGTHDAVVRVEEGGVHGEVGGRAGVRLHVDAPVVGRQAKGLERAVAAEVLELVDHLVATVVPSSGQALRVLVGHARAEALHHGLGGEVLRRNQLDAVHLALFLLDQNVVHLQSKARRPGACENTAVRLGQAAAVTADGRFSEPPQLTTGSQSFRLASEQEAMVGGRGVRTGDRQAQVDPRIQVAEVSWNALCFSRSAIRVATIHHISTTNQESSTPPIHLSAIPIPNTLHRLII